ncbi:fimbrial protein [Buttiauxella selenatireducens]|uniref:Fimbrial protein n=1 Tax=Buttiauxella selenatireducens TaxID=3073902 RepID=A0ABY9SFQ3_9ENTR|nr:fimbrial protein [Buttiauxella sp. R73]WMY76168.1 fimbrial protein [Buttiauxella sp. R73]
MLPTIINFCRPTLNTSNLLCCVLLLGNVDASAEVLQNCFNGPTSYSIDYQQELSAGINKTGKEILSNPGHLVGNGPVMTASCECPTSLEANEEINELTAVGSPLSAGHSSTYGFLTNNIDISVQGYTDAINSPDGAGLTSIPINSYPTPMANMNSRVQNWSIYEESESVCSDSSSPVSPPNRVKRQFKWNVIAAKFYIKKAILGEEIIPSTLVAQYYSCLSFDRDGSCTASTSQLVSNVYLSGKLTAPLSCTINAGHTIEIELGSVVSSNFRTPGVPPKGYSLRDVDISYHCDNPVESTSGKIKLTLTADQGVSDPQGMIAKMMGRDDLGVRLYDKNDQDVVLDGSFDFPVTLDTNGNGSIKLKAAPVSTTSTRPAAGDYEGNVTVKMDIR